MGYLSNIFQEINPNKPDINDIIRKTDAYFAYIDGVFSSNENYIDSNLSDEIIKTCFELKKEIDEFSVLVRLLNPILIKKYKSLSKLSDAVSERIADHNYKIIRILSGKAKTIIGNVEGRQLDKQQMECIVKPVKTHLVIAGAGTGKTTTIVGRVKYLLNSGTCDEKDILVLSFTNASAAEMSERINKETGKDIAASTFHKLGLNIITTVNRITPKVTKIQLQKFVRERLAENIKDQKYLNLLCRYSLHNHKYSRSEFDFTNGSEYDEYLKMNPPVTLKGDQVKSYGEMDIANFLFSNGITYEYEKEYEIDTRTKERFQYYPDFYLPNYGCYIEYFGINDKGEVPSYFTSKDGRSPSEEYRLGMEWKRKLHEKQNTVLIECYSYERSNGELLTSLEKKLKKLGVEFKPISSEEIWAKISEDNSEKFGAGIADLMATVISLMKSNEYDLNRLREICLKNQNVGCNPILVDLIAPIYEAYSSTLLNRGEIDFDDMINTAAQMIRDGRYVNPYKYVIVDEYQDISKSRYNLIKALRDSSDYNLFCVGDDWQGIYRFNGSDLDYILNFSKYWGPAECSKIETTYRFTDSLIDISGGFVMRNPAQIKKSIHGIHSRLGFAMGEIKGYTEKNAIQFMIEKLEELPPDSTVFFIGRYTFDVDLLSKYSELELEYENTTRTIKVVLPARKDLKMEFVTAHGSKGLQADYVFIINNKNRGLGFPCKIQDDPLVGCLLEGKEDFPYAEERRLFYVALTRAKDKAYLVVEEGNESVFVSEMEKRYEQDMKKEAFTCPLCGGNLRRINGRYGEFYGCSNYKVTGCKFTRNIRKKET